MRGSFERSLLYQRMFTGRWIDARGTFFPMRTLRYMLRSARKKRFEGRLTLFAHVAVRATCLAALVFSASAAAEEKQVGWPTYGFDYANTRHVDAGDINRANVAHLTPVWRYVLGPHERVETTPIVVGRKMYVTTGTGDNVIALDATTGKLVWRYEPALGGMAACCGLLNRGVALEGHRVFFATLDAQLIALDADSGKRIWDVRIGNPGYGFSETMAPLAWNGFIFIGSSGSDYGIRGSFSAYRASDGKLMWRWYAVSPGWEGRYVPSVHGMSLHRDIAREKQNAPKFRGAWAQGGGAVWMTPALDAQREELYLVTSNPWPVFTGRVRPGDNLFTDSIVALNAHTGKMRWYYQQTPHDVWEYEASSPPVLFDTLDARGQRIPAVGEAGKPLWFYILDRRDGKLVRLSQSLAANANAYDDPPDGPPQAPLLLRGSIGPISYDPARHLAFITAIERPEGPTKYWRDFLAAVNVNTGRVSWRTPLGILHNGVRGDPLVAGSLSTTDLVFAASPDGIFYGLDPNTGAVVWEYRLGADFRVDQDANLLTQLAHRMHDWMLPIKRWAFRQDAPSEDAAGVDGNPMTYIVNGRQYIAIGFDAHPDRSSGGAVIDVFALR